MRSTIAFLSTAPCVAIYPYLSTIAFLSTARRVAPYPYLSTIPGNAYHSTYTISRYRTMRSTIAYPSTEPTTFSSSMAYAMSVTDIPYRARRAIGPPQS
eukprot:1705709-Rhodomonas_salina.2